MSASFLSKALSERLTEVPLTRYFVESKKQGTIENVELNEIRYRTSTTILTGSVLTGGICLLSSVHGENLPFGEMFLNTLFFLNLGYTTAAVLRFLIVNNVFSKRQSNTSDYDLLDYYAGDLSRMFFPAILVNEAVIPKLNYGFQKRRIGNLVVTF